MKQALAQLMLAVALYSDWRTFFARDPAKVPHFPGCGWGETRSFCDSVNYNFKVTDRQKINDDVWTLCDSGHTNTCRILFKVFKRHP